MYYLQDSIHTVKGIGPNTAAALAKKGIHTVQDLLLWVPLRYEDRSQRASIAGAPVGEVITLEASVVSTNNFYKGRRSIQSAVIADSTGRLKVMWFNNRFIMDTLQRGSTFLFSGKINERGVLLQPTVERVGGDTIHTDRLVPIYSQLPSIKGGTTRRILKEVIDHLELDFDLNLVTPPLSTALQQLHFPDTAESVIEARERLALEEMLDLMRRSQSQKESWATHITPFHVPITGEIVPESVPFTLTPAQTRSLLEIMKDLGGTQPMNRLLVGDVGSGKTVVAGAAAWHTLRAGYHAALVAPTRILAEQHVQTLRKLFPDITIELVSSGTRSKVELPSTPTFFVGTHAVLNKLSSMQPALVMYDEQHRFGVRQRTLDNLSTVPHILTMSATPIPRSVMLTIFAHLQLSTIDELPAGRLPTKTWLVPEIKRSDSYQWIREQIEAAHQAEQALQVLIVCPFIDPAQTDALSNVAAVNELTQTVQTALGKSVRVSSLHGRMSKTEQSEITERLYRQEIDVLVTTPIVEVGIDLPAANIICIEGAERFGLASLHQLRGRVGRAGQQGHCLLFATPNTQSSSQERLEKFARITNGQELAELDLEYRGAGDLFGTKQHGFDDLRFATWTNTEVIYQAREVFTRLLADKQLQYILHLHHSSDDTVAAN